MPIQPSEKAVVLAMLGIGIALLLGSVVSAVMWRKAGVAPTAVVWAGSTVAAHPERYVRPDKLRVVRGLSLAGVVLFLVGILLLVGLGVARLG